MSSVLARLPSPLLPGRLAGYTALAFFSWLIPLGFVLRVYALGKKPDVDALLRAPGLTAAAVLAALLLALLHVRALGSRRIGVAVLSCGGALLALLGTAAGLQPAILLGALPAAAWAYALPSGAFLLWTVSDAQRSAQLLSRMQAGCDGAVAWLEARRSLGGALAIIGALWTLELVLASVNRYFRLVALADTARYDQVFFHTVRGWLGFESIDGINHLGVHFTPSLLVYVPFYLVTPGSFSLLVLQSLALGIAAIPLWYLTLRVTGSRKAALAFTAIYLFHPHVQGININGFRENGLWPVIGFSYLLLLERGEFWRRPLFWVLLPLAMGVKEEMPVTVAAISLALFVQGRDRQAHAVVIALAAVWFLGVTKGLMPWLLGPAGHPERGMGWLFSDHFADMLPSRDAGYTGYLLNAVLHPLLGMGQLVRPEVVKFLLNVGAPLLFLPLLSGWHTLMLIPNLVLTNAFSTDPTVYSTLTKNIAYLVPLFYCGLQGWNRAAGWLEKRGRREGGPLPYLALLVAVLLLTQHAQPWRPVEPDRTIVRRYLEALPRDLKVIVPKCLSPAVSTRPVVRWVTAQQKFDDADLILGQSSGTLCRGENFDFPMLEQRVLDSGRFVRETGPIADMTVYRRKTP